MVIQRWQSVLLFIAAVMMACFAFMSLGQVHTADFALNFTSLGFCYEEAVGGASSGWFFHTWYLFIVSILTIVIPLIAIFLYRNLALQMRVCLFEILFIVADMVVCGVTGYNLIDGGSVVWSFTVCAPVVALVAVIMARCLIKRDRERLRAVDRIR